MAVALVAGEGLLPEEIAARLSGRGERVIVYALREQCEALSEYAEAIVPVYKTELASSIKDMASRGIKRVMFAGYVPKTLIFRPEMLDDMARQLVNGLHNRDDHSLLGGIVSAFEKFGFEIVGYLELLSDLLAPMGFVAGREPSRDELDDINYGLDIARVTVPMSFGQSLVVNRKSVVAVEAMEGTDAMILRSGGLCRNGVLVKMIKPGQDSRYDIPVVGPDTLRMMKGAGLTCLAIQAFQTIILSREEFTVMAGEYGIAVTGTDF